MSRVSKLPLAMSLALLAALNTVGCVAPMGWFGRGACSGGTCQTGGCQSGTCNTGSCNTGTCNTGCQTDSCNTGCGCGGGFAWYRPWGCCGLGCCGGGLAGMGAHRSLAIPDMYALGTVQRKHFELMETNAEAMDFILFDLDFVNQSAELTPDGKDKILEIAARMRSQPFPVIVERTTNNADPELDAHRRQLVARILTDLGNADAANRVMVAPSYGPGMNSLSSEPTYYQHVFQGYGNNNNGLGGGGGFGGGGFGGGAGGGFF